MKKSIVIILMLIISTNLFAQGEANIWYFGENAGLDFNDCTPTPIDGGQINTREGCSSFSDASGNLLFYSDGTTVWNKNHDVMHNGNYLLGNPSSSQSAMIIPKPGSNTIYYIFTVGTETGEGDEAGFNYYIVDMEEDSGLGAIVNGPIDLSQGRALDWTEKVAAVKGDEDGTFWVVSYVPGEFVAYKVTNNGVASTPITSTAFTAIDRRGYLKISPDGTKLAVAHQADEQFILYDFDDATGIINNERILPLDPIANKPYGVEFSANSTKLYVHSSNDTSGDTPLSHSSSLFQFDVSTPFITNIINSKTLIDSRNLFRGALQLGPDKKIYRALSETYLIGSSYLGVIENPEEDGVNCNYQHNSIYLGENNSSQGLPPFIASIFTQIQITGEDLNGNSIVLNNQTLDLCVGDNIDIIPEPLEGSSFVYTWYFNRAFYSNSESISLTNITDANSGSYALTVEYTDSCGNVITRGGSFEIDVHSPPIGPAEITLSNCDVDDNPNDGYTAFNLELANPFLLLENNNSSNLSNEPTDSLISYHYTYSDANDEINEIDSSLPFNNATSSVVYAHVNSLYGCGYYISIVNLDVSINSFPPNYKYTISSCDDDNTNDGIHSFDLTEATNSIISQFPLNDNLVVSYYRNLLDAQLKQNRITSEANYINNIPFLQNIFVHVEDSVEGICFSIGQYVDLIVNPIPEFEVDSEALLCLIVSPTITLETYNPSDDYSYSWLNEQGIEMGNDTSLTVSSGGLYTVIATTDLGCELIKTINVIEFETQEINPDDVSIIDDSENNTITINTDNNGLGDGNYSFSLDNEFGPFQSNAFFEHVLPGEHILYYKANNGCGTGKLDIFVLGFPNFFTPNNDGYNDFWNVLGLDKNFYTTSKIHIFDRFGKIVSIIKTDSNGWNGQYNGKDLPETDYWFSINLIDDNGVVRTKKGHFSLIRR